MELLFGIGMIIFGLFSFVVTLFKYTKKAHKEENFSGGSTDLFGFILEMLLAILPWWFAKTLIMLISIGIIIAGIMLLLI